MNTIPLIVDIKRHSLEDGPGIRSVVFFKGCPLRCVFCQNVETQEPEAEIAFNAGECINCGSCADACPYGVIDLEFPGRIHRDRCNRCGACAKVCPGNGLKIVGSSYPVETLTEILLRDLPFYRHSGGGVTLSGGEPTLYPDYVEGLLKNLKAKDVHIVLETSGYFDYESCKQHILPYLDFIYYDVKFADPGLHKKFTGVANRRIIDNLGLLLSENGIEVHPRIPLIPGITTPRENLSAIVDLLVETGAIDVSLLPYNPMGMEMAVNLGKAKPHLSDGFMKQDEEREVQVVFQTILGKKKTMGDVRPA